MLEILEHLPYQQQYQQGSENVLTEQLALLNLGFIKSLSRDEYEKGCKHVNIALVSTVVLDGTSSLGLLSPSTNFVPAGTKLQSGLAEGTSFPAVTRHTTFAYTFLSHTSKTCTSQ